MNQSTGVLINYWIELNHYLTIKQSMCHPINYIFVFQSIECTAVSANVPIPSGLNSDPAEFGHGSNKSVLESLGIGCPGIDGGFRPGIGEEDLVGGEEPLSRHQVLEVDVVKSPWGGGVHVDGYRGVHDPGAHRLQLACVCSVESRVDWILRAEIVYPVCKPVTV